LCSGQAICVYTGPRLPLDVIQYGEYALEIPGSGVVIDGARENCPPSERIGPGSLSPAIYANHSSAPNARLEHWPATASELDRIVLVAIEPIHAGYEVRFDYENGARRGTYWRGASDKEPTCTGTGTGTGTGKHANQNKVRKPIETSRWRSLFHPPPPPACEEPVVDYLQQLRARQQSADDAGVAARRAAAHAQMLPTSQLSGRAATEEGRSVERFVPEGGSFAPRRESPAVVLGWSGPQGGDAVLRDVISLVERSEWLLQCIRRSDGKAVMWKLVATHLPGRTPEECRQRWRMLSHSRSAAARGRAVAPPVAAPSTESIELLD